MRGTLAHLAEVIRGPHNTFAEMPLPDAIYHHARRERMVRPRQPLCQSFASAAGGDLWLGCACRQDFWEAFRRVLTRAVVVASNEDLLIDRLALVHRASHVRLRRRR